MDDLNGVCVPCIFSHTIHDRSYVYGSILYRRSMPRDTATHTLAMGHAMSFSTQEGEGVSDRQGLHAYCCGYMYSEIIGQELREGGVVGFGGIKKKERKE